MKKLFKIIKGIVWTVILVFLALIAVTFLPIKGNYKVYTVQSGSMEPAIHLGSLIFVKAQKDYNVGDVVTRRTEDPKVNITHRIFSKKEENGQTVFETKGDANDSPDGETVTKDKIIGKEFLKFPYVGYPIGYARTTIGFLILVIIPAVIIIYEEMRKIKEEAINIFKKRKEKKEIQKGSYPSGEKYTSPIEAGNVRSICFEPKKNMPKVRGNPRRRMGL